MGVEGFGIGEGWYVGRRFFYGFVGVVCSSWVFGSGCSEECRCE